MNKLKDVFSKEIHGKGLFIGVELDSRYAKGRDIVLQLLEYGLLGYETHDTVIRSASPLVISKEQLGEVLAILKKVLLINTA